jgi:hypothetical protein
MRPLGNPPKVISLSVVIAVGYGTINQNRNGKITRQFQPSKRLHYRLYL